MAVCLKASLGSEGKILDNVENTLEVSISWGLTEDFKKYDRITLSVYVPGSLFDSDSESEDFAFMELNLEHLLDDYMNDHFDYVNNNCGDDEPVLVCTPMFIDLLRCYADKAEVKYKEYLASQITT